MSKSPHLDNFQPPTINVKMPAECWYMSGAALAPKMLAPEKSPGIKFCRQFQKVGARKFRCHNS